MSAAAPPAERVYVIADSRGRFLLETASPHDRQSVADKKLAKQFTSAAAARTWLALADEIAPRARGDFEVQWLPAVLLELRVDQLGDGGPQGGAVPPHVDLAGVALDHVDAGVAASRVVAHPGGQVHPERPLVGVAEGVALQHPAPDGLLLEPPPEFRPPGPHSRGAASRAK